MKSRGESFVFYETFWNQAKAIKDPAMRLMFLEAIAGYGIEGVKPDFSNDTTGMMEVIFCQIQYSIDHAKAKRKTNSENGKKGGGQKGNTNACKSSGPKGKNERKRAKTSENEPNVNVNVNVNDNDNDNVNVNVNDNENECVNTDHTQYFSEEERKILDIKKLYWHNEFVRGDWMNKYMLSEEEYYTCLCKTIDYVKMRYSEWGEREIGNYLPKEIEKYSRTPKGTLQERREKLQNEMERYKTLYDTKMLHDFWQYWTQVDKVSGFMKYERLDVFDIGKRLDLWKQNKK